jgi:hypothetical protein
LHHQIQQGKLKIINGCAHSSDGLVSPTAELATV